LECQQNICELAAKMHRRQSMSMTHRVMTLAELSAQPELQQPQPGAPQLCKSHGKPLELFDMTCRQLLCSFCVPGHLQHRVHTVPEAAALCRAELGEWTARLDALAGQVEATLSACDARGTEVQEAHDREMDKINKACD